MLYFTVRRYTRLYYGILHHFALNLGTLCRGLCPDSTPKPQVILSLKLDSEPKTGLLLGMSSHEVVNIHVL